MSVYSRQLISVFLSFVVLSSLFSTQLLSSDKVYAQVPNNNNQIPLGLPNACVFDDGDSPQDPEECFPIRNNEDTQGVDNIFFTLRSDTTVDRFSCELRDINNNLVELSQVPDNPSNCLKDQNNAEQQYTNLPDGTYIFQVIAFKTVVVDDDDPTINRQNAIRNEVNGLVQVELRGESQPFRFIVGTGGEAGEGGAGFVDRDNINAVPPAALDQTARSERLNPVFQTCEATNANKREGGTVTPTANQRVQNGLSAMKYSAFGVLSLHELDSELKKFNTNDFVLEIFVNFLSGQIAADIYPTAKDIEKVRTKADLYKLNPFLVTEEQVAHRDDSTPNRFPFGIQALDTECVYTAPPVAVSLTTGGSNVFVNPEIFQNGNPPFQECTGSDAATYTVTFSIDRHDRNKFDAGYHNVRIVIVQDITGNNPHFEGFLIFNPFENDEERVKLLLNGQSIVTECRNSIIFASDP